ncbi:MAG: hypothetical protein NTZ67_04195 [Gammaproteobacteria bacterium]|nr:hypothetical protein [Gammaproteobacteria bacterium]
MTSLVTLNADTHDARIEDIKKDNDNVAATTPITVSVVPLPKKTTIKIFPESVVIEISKYLELNKLNNLLPFITLFPEGKYLLGKSIRIYDLDYAANTLGAKPEEFKKDKKGNVYFPRPPFYFGLKKFLDDKKMIGKAIRDLMKRYPQWKHNSITLYDKSYSLFSEEGSQSWALPPLALSPCEGDSMFERDYSALHRCFTGLTKAKGDLELLKESAGKCGGVVLFSLSLIISIMFWALFAFFKRSLLACPGTHMDFIFSDDGSSSFASGYGICSDLVLLCATGEKQCLEREALLCPPGSFANSAWSGPYSWSAGDVVSCSLTNQVGFLCAAIVSSIWLSVQLCIISSYFVRNASPLPPSAEGRLELISDFFRKGGPAVLERNDALYNASENSPVADLNVNSMVL